jgi:hypothetical protein
MSLRTSFAVPFQNIDLIRGSLDRSDPHQAILSRCQTVASKLCAQSKPSER